MAEENVASPQGEQATTAPVTGQAAEVAPFYQWKRADGEVVPFKTKDDLDKAMGQSFLMEKDYTKKTQTLAEFRKAVEKEKAELAKQREEHEHRAREYQDFDWLIKNRPDIYKQLQGAMQSVPSPDVAVERAKSYADEQVNAMRQELEEMKSTLQEQALQRQRVELLGNFHKKYADYPDDETVDAILDELGSGELDKVLEFVYHAHKGRQNPLEVEKRVAEAKKKEEGAKLMPSQGAAPADNEYVPKNLDEAANLALKRLRGG